MTTLENRPRTGLLIIDAQRKVLDRTFQRDEAVANMVIVLERARQNDIPVVWVQHSDDDLEEGSDDWQYVPELTRAEAEAVVHKHYGDSFEATNLEQVLADAGVGRLVVTGAQSDACIRSTIHGAFTRGYDVTLVGDAHTTEDSTEWGSPPPEVIVDYTNQFWKYQSAPGRTAGVVPTAEVAFGS